MSGQSSEASDQDVATRLLHVRECQLVADLTGTLKKSVIDIQAAIEKVKLADVGTCFVDNTKQRPVSDFKEMFSDCRHALDALERGFLRHMEQHPVCGRGREADSGYDSQANSRVLSGTDYGMPEMPLTSYRDQPEAMGWNHIPIQEEGDRDPCSQC